MDTDEFDLFCEHLIVEDRLEPNPARRIVGTYRMQSGVTAKQNLGYYSEQEFFFEPYEPLRAGVLELGRASIAQDHRTPEVLTLLWRGIAQYASGMGLRYLIGCSSLNSRESSEGWQLYGQLLKYRASADLQTQPKPGYLCPERESEEGCGSPASTRESQGISAKIPKLLRTYLTIGARICAPPAWDREFGTIDFLTLLDLKLLTASARNHFLMPSVH
jgi:putative hemolysin